jgi:hypothetical protein
MRTPFSWPVGHARPLTALALGWTLVTPLSALAAGAEDTSTSAATPRAVMGAASVRTESAAPGEARYALATGAGVVFHRTGRPVHALRTLRVPGSAHQLHTWEEEQPDGSRQPFYAYSQDGAAPLGRARATSHKVRLHAGHFDPLRDPEPRSSSLLAARADNTLFLVQLPATPLPEFRRAIEGLGGKVLRFLTDHTFLVELDAEARARVAAQPYVRWVGPYHPEFRLEPELREALVGRAARLPAQRYSILLGERGAQRQQKVVALVQRVGGTVELVEPGGLRVEATLTQEQLLEVARANDVQFIDRWGGPGEVDMNVVREAGGANALETVTGWNGQGVRGEIFDTELRTSHQEWALPPLIHSKGTTSQTLHGTSVYSNAFARGVDPKARGLLPGGQGIFFRSTESTQFGGRKSRYDINRELTDPAGPYRAVFQTSSTGGTQVRTYNTISAEVDDYLFLHPILSTQSQSNTGTQDSRPQAWAKNIVSVGAVYHSDTVSRTDDKWGAINSTSGAGSTGPAADGRVKPDLSFFYDYIHSAEGSSNTSYTSFCCTSSATPQTAGHFGLLFQMWHEGVWAGHGRKADVFASRPQMATAKALMVNMASRYNWLAGGSNGDITRFRQGWGTADVKRLHERAAVTSVIDETDVLTPLGIKSYTVNVAAGQPELNVTMVYTDPMGTVGAAHARINDLSLRVTSPSGVVYWGNNGLTAGNVSTPGGTSNTIDTVENVFLQSPEAGAWTVEVLADELVQDARLETPAIDADYGLVVSGGLIQ